MKNKSITNRSTLVRTVIMALSWMASLSLAAQVRVDWQQCYGSLGNDYGHSVIQNENALTVLGQVETDSPSGMYEGNCQGAFMNNHDWLIGIAGDPSVAWQNCSSIGLCQQLHSAGNGQYYVTEMGIDNYSYLNLKITKTDGEGNPIWIRYHGCPDGLPYWNPVALSLGSPDGGIVCAAIINEAGGDVIQHFGGFDCWVVKLDSEGNIVWQTTLGTEGDESVTCLQGTADGGLLVWVDSDLTGNGNIGCGQQEKKGVLVKLDATGQLQWSLCFPRTAVRSIVELEDGFLLAGESCHTVEPNGNCSDGIYSYDCFLTRCNTDGSILWDKEYGGSCNDKIVKAFQSEEGGFTAFANSKSSDGDVASFANLGVTGDEEGNVWIFHVDSGGGLQWEYCIGSQLGLFEEMKDVIMTGDKEYVVVGHCTWFDGVSSGLVQCTNNAILPDSGHNVWVLQVTDLFDYTATAEASEPNDAQVLLSPNPANGIVTVTGKALRQAEVFNAAGQCTATATGTEDEIRIDLRQLPAGIYFVTVTDAEGRKCVKKVVKE